MKMKRRTRRYFLKRLSNSNGVFFTNLGNWGPLLNQKLNTFARKIVNMPFEKLRPEIEKIIQDSNLTIDERLKQICERLQETVPYYDWVGFYFKNGNKEELKLRSYAGEPTDHEIIPFGKGICGQVAVSNQNFVVPDVKAQNNYIACSIHVKAEIVVPLFVNGENIGQIDIDSHTPDPFSHEDEIFLEWVNQKVAEIL